VGEPELVVHSTCGLEKKKCGEELAETLLLRTNGDVCASGLLSAALLLFGYAAVCGSCCTMLPRFHI
jgi:hypothetical protein